MTIFDRGDYRAFLVVASADDLDRALYAFPIFEGEPVSEVFKYYSYLYFPDTAKISFRRDGDLDDPAALGLVLADVRVDGVAFKVSTVTIEHALWVPIVKQWEDQWVFDHLVSTTGSMPSSDYREFKGGKAVQAKVAAAYSGVMFDIAILVFTAFIGLIFWTMHNSQQEDADA